ncbi:unnamed protein product [Ostreobium quekettii]|uniref:RHOMBOID-like protein n=1 Tax=Ostreobium quekettii TaxID=121088 RepID=A0A8S1J5I4_9CHLO|nr:unnamed protein product [Ostreobium quekettii]|eukprot:evm.model.scf_231.6 EVM.evm.TU.scf_231.6   scf_231:75330-78478(-)
MTGLRDTCEQGAEGIETPIMGGQSPCTESGIGPPGSSSDSAPPDADAESMPLGDAEAPATNQALLDTSASVAAIAEYLGVLVSSNPAEALDQILQQRESAAGKEAKDDGESQLPVAMTADDAHRNHKSSGRQLRHLVKMLARYRHRRSTHRKLFVEALKRKIENRYPAGTQFQKWQDTAFITSIQMFDMFTPNRRARHVVWATFTMMAVTFVVFAFMAGAFPLYRFQKGYEDDLDALGWGPHDLWDWATDRNNTTRFDFEFLLGWGGRYLPSVSEGQYYRWFTSIILHQSLVHLLSNALIFVVLGSYLEFRYGSLRVLAVVLLAGLGGNFLSAVAEDRCSIVVGGSGVVFGFMGFAIVDLVLNRELLLHTAIRVIICALFVTFLVMTLVLEEYSSHISHAGGFLCGFAPALLFTPDLKYERVEAMLVWGVAAFIAVYFTALPAAIYHGVLPDLQC